MSIYVAPPAKAVLGPGAAALTTQPMLRAFQGPLAQQKLMYHAASFWKSDPWIRSAERVISGKFSTVEWHLEDANDDAIDDAYPDPRYQAVVDLFERPQATITLGRQMTRRELWSITSRHMGACGNAFWYLDQREPIGQTPGALLYIAPWRMSAAQDAAGNLTGWVLDYNDTSGTGTPLQLSEILQFTLEPPDEGHFGVGLVESAMGWAQLGKTTLGYVSNIIANGGRLAGIVSPKSDPIPNEQFQQLVRDFRTITELPDSAKRVNILQSPVQFDRTAATPLELSMLDLMNSVRDDILTLWGVPISQIGGTTPAGLNGGEMKKFDEAALWQGAIHPRIVGFVETVQYQLLDRWEKFGMKVELEITEPEFDDDGPRYDLLQKAVNLPMRNWERRAQIGLDPFGDPVLDNAVWLPNTLIQVAVAPDVSGLNTASDVEIGTTSDEAEPDEAEPGVDTSGAPVAGKATLRHSLTAIRARVERQHTNALRTALAVFLDSQRRDIVARLRANAEHISRRPRDADALFPPSLRRRWDTALSGVLQRPLSAMAITVNEHIAKTLTPTKAGPVSAVNRALTRGAARVTKINDTTRSKIQDAVAQGIEDGLSVLEVADLIEQGDSETLGLDLGSIFSEYRAEMIARTELMDAYNGAALASYGDAGVQQVQAIDGDGDEECAARSDQIFDIDEAATIEDHPNGTLDWVPVLAEEAA